MILKNISLILFLSLLLSGCSSGGTSPAAYYKGSQPVQYNKTPVQATPDYYYSQPYSQQQYSRQPQTYQNPYQQVPQSYGGAPASRFYNNPYSFQPSAQYPYYDSDHYYVPPTYYGAPDGGGALAPNKI